MCDFVAVPLGYFIIFHSSKLSPPLPLHIPFGVHCLVSCLGNSFLLHVLTRRRKYFCLVQDITSATEMWVLNHICYQ